MLVLVTGRVAACRLSLGAREDGIGEHAAERRAEHAPDRDGAGEGEGAGRLRKKHR